MNAQVRSKGESGLGEEREVKRMLGLLVLGVVRLVVVVFSSQ